MSSSAQQNTEMAALRGMALQQGQNLARPVESWRPAQRLRFKWSARTVAIAALLAGAAATAVMATTGRRTAGVEKPSVAPARAASLPAPLQPLEAATARVNASAVSQPAKRAPAPVASPPAAAPRVGSPTVRREARIELRDGEIRMQLRAVPLDEAVRLLAAATHTSVRGVETLPSRLAPVALQWQGRGADAAWQRLLGDRMSYASRCSAERCDLWVAGPITTWQAASAPPPARVVLATAVPAPSAITPEPLTEQAQLAAFGVPQ